VALSSCGTIDVGPDVLPEQGCNAPPAFFVSDVWPQYFANYQCGMSACHDAVSGRGFFRLHDVSMVTAPSPMMPESVWPFEWQQNLTNVEQNISCANPVNSLVLAIPSGMSTPHPGGDVVTDVPAAETLFTTWLKP
jgi:hypothetical protein